MDLGRVARRLHRKKPDKSVREVSPVSQVASHASIIHSQNHAFTGRSRSAGDAQQPASPFSLLLDDAGGAPSLPAKTSCELPQASQTALPQTPEQATPEPQIASATLPLLSPLPFPESEKAAETAKTTAEVATVALLDQNQSDTTDPADPSAITAVLIDANAPLLPPPTACCCHDCAAAALADEIGIGAAGGGIRHCRSASLGSTILTRAAAPDRCHASVNSLANAAGTKCGKSGGVGTRDTFASAS